MEWNCLCAFSSQQQSMTSLSFYATNTFISTTVNLVISGVWFSYRTRRWGTNKSPTYLYFRLCLTFKLRFKVEEVIFQNDIIPPIFLDPPASEKIQSTHTLRNQTSALIIHMHSYVDRFHARQFHKITHEGQIVFRSISQLSGKSL